MKLATSGRGTIRRLALSGGALLMALVCFGALSPAAYGAPATISTSFGATSIPLNGSTSLSFTISNPNQGSSLSSVGFTDELPRGLVVSSPSGLENLCEGTAVAASGSRTISLSGATLQPGVVCFVSLNVTGVWGGEKKNSVTVGSSGGTGNTSTASLTVDVPTGERVYWTDGELSFANLDGSGGGDLPTGEGGAGDASGGVSLDPAAGRVYWGSFEHIAYANLDGSGGEADLNTGFATTFDIEGMALNPGAGRIYWANLGVHEEHEAISYANLNGTGGANLPTVGATVDEPFGVAFDPTTGRIYWANSNTISYADLNGAGAGDLPTTGATVSLPRGVAVDPAAGRIYWANTSADKISYANLNGTGGGDLDTGTATVESPIGVAVDPGAGRIYWANYEAPSIAYANLDGSGSGEIPTIASHGNKFPALLRKPVGAGAPVISGGSAPGTDLSCSPGTWAPDLLGSFLYRAPRSFAYQWSLDGGDVAGATSSSYTASTPGEYRCRVTASNFAGSSVQTSSTHTVASPTSAAPSNAFRFGKLKRNRKKGTAVLTIILPGAGTLAFSGMGLKTQAIARSSAALGSIPVRGPGPVHVLITAVGRTKRQLNRTGKAKVKLGVTFTPTGGSPKRLSKRIKLARAR